MTTTINVVGAGIAGSLVARLLRKLGHQVRVFDDNDPCAGSRASSNLYIASWLKKFNQDASDGIQILESLFPPEQIDNPFKKGIMDALKIKHIAQKHLMVEPDVREKVTGLWPGGVETSEKRHEGPVVLCMGYRAGELVSGSVHSGLDVLVGHCLLIKGVLPPGTASITMPLPYRHLKCYQLDDETIYFADSTRLTRKSFEKRKDQLLLDLTKKATTHLASLGMSKAFGFEHRVGYRPVVPGRDFGELVKIAPNMWSINGGGKNGLVAYANLAAQLAEELV